MTSDHGQPAQSFASIGIDIGKDVFHIVGFDAAGRVVLPSVIEPYIPQGTRRRTDQAVREFFPDGPVTVSTLRTAIRKRKLQATMPEGKLLVTEAWLVEWLNRCRVAVNLPDCGSSPAIAGEPVSGSSRTDRNARALDAADATLNRLSASSQSTSEASTSRRPAKANSS